MFRLSSKLSLTIVSDTANGLSPGALILLICKFRILSHLLNGWPLVALYMVTDLPLVGRTKIAFISIDPFPLSGQIYLAVMNRSRCDLNIPNQTIFHIHIAMKLEAKMNFIAFLGPSSIFASASFGFVSTTSKLLLT